MPRQYCFLCASDEGVFLEITADNKQIFREQFEVCALLKVLRGEGMEYDIAFRTVPTGDQLPTKICHKCAYELNQCSSFLQKYKHTSKEKVHAPKQCCSLCLEPAKKEFIFDISKDKGLQIDSLKKIQKLFNHKVDKLREDHKLICLSCRYTVDVLLDLKTVCMETSTKFNEIISKGIDYLTFPKIKTKVVSRKTTITESARLNSSEEFESDSDKMTRTRSQNNKLSNNEPNAKPKLRVCDKCQNFVKAGKDMYKVHKTGDTVCRSCWKNIDACTSEAETGTSQNVTETKLCTVFLIDVLKSINKSESLYRIDKDDQGNDTYVITDRNSTSSNKRDKAVGGVANSIGKPGQKRSVKSMTDEDKATSPEDVPNKRHKSNAKDEPKELGTVARKTRRLVKKTRNHNINQKSDSDSYVKASARRNTRILTRHKRATGSSLSDADIDNKRNRKKLSTILKGIATLKTIDVSDESSSNDDVRSRRKRLRITRVSPVTIDLTADETPETSEVSRKGGKPKKESKSNTIVEVLYEPQALESDKEEIIFETETHVCDECGAIYENKLVVMIHKLTHYKQPQLKLHKLRNESLERDKTGPSVVVDDQSEDPSEAIAIRVDDDEEEPNGQLDSGDAGNRKEIDSDGENKTHSSQKESLEDDVDVELVLKESDDDRRHKSKKDSDEGEETETSGTNFTARDEDVPKKDEEELGSRGNSNDKTDRTIHELPDDKDTNTEEQDMSCSGNKDAVGECKEDKKEKDIIEEDSKNGLEEKVEKSEHVIEKDKEEGDDNDATNSDKENEEEQNVCKKQEDAISDKENLNTSKTNGEKYTSDVEEVESTKKVECNETEKEEGSKELDVITNNASSVEGTVEQRLSQHSEESKSDENELQAKGNITDPEKSEIVAEDTVLPKEGSIIDEDKDRFNDVEVPESKSDSVNAAAEVLQEVLDLASAEVKKRQELAAKNTENDSIESETLENISREIQNTVTMQPLKIDDAKSEADTHQQ